MSPACEFELLTYEAARIRNVSLYAVTPAQVALGSEISDPRCVVWQGELRMLEQELVPEEDDARDSHDRLRYTPSQRHNLKIEFFHKTHAAPDHWAAVYYTPGSEDDGAPLAVKPSAHSSLFYHILAQLPFSECVRAPTNTDPAGTIQVALGLRFNAAGDALEFQDSLRAYERRFAALQDDFYERQARRAAAVLAPPSPALSPLQDLATSQTVSNESESDDSDFDAFVSAT